MKTSLSLGSTVDYVLANDHIAPRQNLYQDTCSAWEVTYF